MKKLTITFILTASVTVFALLANSCSSMKSITDQSGSDLWANDCGRCHNAPPSTSYTNEQWDVLGMHMKVRAHITDDEMKKIVAFLKSGQ